ncbi:predicted protein [Uncinocarpus reesii 1704]|uniref:Uncharacterized protein n=1 Tax=Uncinocarpus reesii (strain UAMH 1704) TaxID=336963 RepID=C4JXA7_UNCRE|nr:uncharacterized protein UREG_06280 [Uncinocarpus reesii 1704]EEP81415.1 predicted protein [Uncinocarpus reesii 1704]
MELSISFPLENFSIIGIAQPDSQIYEPEKMRTPGLTAVAAKTSHVNLMTDTVIANLNPETLRAVIRSMLAGDQEGQLASTFQKHVQKYLQRDNGVLPVTASLNLHGEAPFHKTMESINNLRMRILALLGCGLPFESLEIVAGIVRHSAPLLRRVDLADEDTLLSTLAAIDADLVQASTAIQSYLMKNGNRSRLSECQVRALVELKQGLDECQRQSDAHGTEFAFERGMDMLDEILAMVKR